MDEEPQRAKQGDDRGGAAAPVAHSPLGTIPLNDGHNVEEFVCSKSERVCGFLRDEARALAKIGYCGVYIWPDPQDPSRVLGYYTLSASSMSKGDLANKHERRVPKGLPVPIVLIGYMGKTDGALKGLGGLLLFDAALRVSQNLENGPGVWGLALEPENDRLARWYVEHGFVAAKSRERFMYGRLSDFLPAV